MLHRNCITIYALYIIACACQMKTLARTEESDEIKQISQEKRYPTKANSSSVDSDHSLSNSASTLTETTTSMAPSTHQTANSTSEAFTTSPRIFTPITINSTTITVASLPASAKVSNHSKSLSAFSLAHHKRPHHQRKSGNFGWRELSSYENNISAMFQFIICF